MVLPIFPRSGFDQSVTTPVLLGVLASWLFTETFGWVFAGLVVPGYLASVFLLAPAAGVIDIFEAVLTYFVARLIGEHLPRIGVTSRVFGRERFFLVVLVSILVRLAVEGWLLPRAVPHATWAYSVGLVVVPLAANACWKTGLARGIVQNGVPALLVYLMLRWVLVPHTNLSLAGFELATENMAASFLASPKAYILLITGALLAAAANVRYGWDFNGILVPALLGLALAEPVKFGATFVEALLLWVVVLILIRLTPLKRANIEGPRRTVLFFTVDYALRFAWAGVAGRSLPGGDIVAFMGFGYLLPTLLAVKISQKGSAPLVLLPTLKVSVLGFVMGSLIGFAAHLFDGATAPPPQALAARTMPRPPSSPEGAALWVSQLAIDGLPEPDSSVTGDLTRIRDFLEAVAKGDLARARAANVEAAAITDGVMVVRERFDTLLGRRGLPTYVFRMPLPEQPVVVLVPTPLACPASAAAAGKLIADGDADAVVLAGIEEPKKAWLDLETTAHAAARWLARGGTFVTVRDLGDPRIAQANDVPASLERVAKASRRFAGTRLLAQRGELVLAIDPTAVGVALAPQRWPIPLGSATEIAGVLEGVRAATHPGELEHLIGLRRLVLDPLLAPAANGPSRALAPFAAATLGYRLTAPSPWPGGGEGVALLPAQRDLPIALFARTSGVHDRVVEAPVGAHRGVRDVAVRLGVALGADAIILGEAFDGAMRAGAVRAAHAAATDAHAPTVFVVREDKTASATAKVAAWMDDGRGLATAHRAFDALGIVVVDAAPDLPLRDMASRTLLRPTAVIALTAGPKTFEAASLDQTRRAHEQLDVPLRDGALGEAAAALEAGLDTTRAAAAAAEGIDEVVRRAAEGSIVAAHRLSGESATTALRLALVRAREGSFIVGVARTKRETLVIAADLAGAGAWRTERRPTLRACIESPVVPGVCGAPVSP